MGWYGCEAWRTKADVVKEVIAEFSKTKVLDKALVGGTLYIACEQDIDGKPERFVAVYLISKAGGTWGYKPMDESMGPVERKCPLRILDAATPGPTHEWAVEWRKDCREYHAAEATRKALIKSLKVGSKVMLKNRKPNGPFEVVSLKPLRGHHNGNLYRLPKTAVAHVVPEIASV